MAIDLGELGDFLIEKKGGLDVLLKIDIEQGDKTSDLQSKVNAAPDTVQKRLRSAETMGLLKEVRLPEDHGNTNRYQLTEEGENIREDLIEAGIEENRQQAIEAQEKLTDSLIDFIYDTQQEGEKSNQTIDGTDLIDEDHRHPFHRRSLR